MISLFWNWPLTTLMPAYGYAYIYGPISKNLSPLLLSHIILIPLGVAFKIDSQILDVEYDIFWFFCRFLFLPEVPSPDEVESYAVLQECLELRKRYLFREAVAPWEKEIISDPSTPKPNPAPFFYAPEGKSDVSVNIWFWYSILLLTNVCF